MQENPILVTGSNSGLGKHCCEYFSGVGFSRQTSFSDITALAAKKPFKAIIHSAFNTKPDTNSRDLYTYLNDTILLTKKLLQIPHEKFIFISSCDVYPKNNEMHHEDEIINLKDISNMYGNSKIISESIVQNETNDFLILRPTAMLGPYAKKNSLMRVLTEENPTLTLANNSSFNYVLHSDISAFIQHALEKKVTGIYNIAASSNVLLGDVARQFNRDVQFGQFTYTTPQISNQKAAEIFNNFKRTSLENIDLFFKN